MSVLPEQASAVTGDTGQFNQVMSYLGFNCSQQTNVPLSHFVHLIRGRIKSGLVTNPIPDCVFDGNKVIFLFGTRQKFKKLLKISKKFPSLIIGRNDPTAYTYEDACYRNLYDCFGLSYPKEDPIGKMYTLKEILDDLIPKLDRIGFSTQAAIPEPSFSGNLIHFATCTALNSAWKFDDLLDLMYSGVIYYVDGTYDLPMFHKYPGYKAPDLLHLLFLFPNCWDVYMEAFSEKPERLVKGYVQPPEERLFWMNRIVNYWSKRQETYYLAFTSFMELHHVTIEQACKWKDRPRITIEQKLIPKLAERKKPLKDRQIERQKGYLSYVENTIPNPKQGEGSISQSEISTFQSPSVCSSTEDDFNPPEIYLNPPKEKIPFSIPFDYLILDDVIRTDYDFPNESENKKNKKDCNHSDELVLTGLEELILDRNEYEVPEDLSNLLMPLDSPRAKGKSDSSADSAGGSETLELEPFDSYKFFQENPNFLLEFSGPAFPKKASLVKEAKGTEGTFTSLNLNLETVPVSEDQEKVSTNLEFFVTPPESSEDEIPATPKQDSLPKQDPLLRPFMAETKSFSAKKHVTKPRKPSSAELKRQKKKERKLRHREPIKSISSEILDNSELFLEESMPADVVASQDHEEVIASQDYKEDSQALLKSFETLNYQGQEPEMVADKSLKASDFDYFFNMDDVYEEESETTNLEEVIENQPPEVFSKSLNDMLKRDLVDPLTYDRSQGSLSEQSSVASSWKSKLEERKNKNPSSPSLSSQRIEERDPRIREYQGIRLRNSYYQKIKKRQKVQIPYKKWDNSCYADSLCAIIYKLGITPKNHLNSEEEEAFTDYWLKLCEKEDLDEFGILQIDNCRCSECKKVHQVYGYYLFRNPKLPVKEIKKITCPHCNKLAPHVILSYFEYSEFCVWYNPDVVTAAFEGRPIPSEPIDFEGVFLGGINYSGNGEKGHYYGGKGNFAVISQTKGSLPPLFFQSVKKNEPIERLIRQADYNSDYIIKE